MRDIQTYTIKYLGVSVGVDFEQWVSVSSKPPALSPYIYNVLINLIIKELRKAHK
jgi:hypothetical protein